MNDNDNDNDNNNNNDNDNNNNDDTNNNNSIDNNMCCLPRVASLVVILFSLRALQSYYYTGFSRAIMKTCSSIQGIIPTGFASLATDIHGV